MSLHKTIDTIGFSDSAVTVLGLYYKLQTFFFIPLMGLQTCIVPVLSFNYATKSYSRCREIMKESYLFSCVVMLLGVICFVFFPAELIRIFSDSRQVISIGKQAFPIIGASFIPVVFSLMTPVFFQVIVSVLGMLLYSKTVASWRKIG